MATMYFDNTMVGAPALTLVDGSLIAILDWALLQNGWAIQYTGTNQRVYRAGTGARMVLQVYDSSAASGGITSARVRAAESATSVSALVDPFPTVALVPDANSNWGKGNPASPGTARDWKMIVTPTYFSFEAKDTVGTDLWEFNCFGETVPINAEDAWNTVCTNRNIVGSATNNTSPTVNSVIAVAAQSAPTSVISNVKFWWARDITGAIKTTKGIWASDGTVVNSITNMPVARAGYANRINRKRIAIHCYGTNGGTVGPTVVQERGFLPNKWRILHSNLGALTSADTFIDTAYNPAAVFAILPSLSVGGTITEITDTWTIPN